MRGAGIEPQVVVSGVDEDFEHADVREIVLELARRKARAVAAGFDDALVLGCDSLFLQHGEIHGKPSSAEQAREWWHAMRGSHGTLFTGHHLIDVARARDAEAVVASTVYFASPDDDEIDRYIASGEPLRVAGAFSIDGFAAPFVERIDGEPSNVEGLSLSCLRRLFRELDASLLELWDAK